MKSGYFKFNKRINETDYVREPLVTELKLLVTTNLPNLQVKFPIFAFIYIFSLRNIEVRGYIPELFKKLLTHAQLITT